MIDAMKGKKTVKNNTKVDKPVVKTSPNGDDKTFGFKKPRPVNMGAKNNKPKNMATQRISNLKKELDRDNQTDEKTSKVDTNEDVTKDSNVIDNVANNDNSNTVE